MSCHSAHPVPVVGLLAAAASASLRPSAVFQPTVWGDFFINDDDHDDSTSAAKHYEWISRRIDELVERVKVLFRRSSSSSSAISTTISPSGEGDFSGDRCRRQQLQLLELVDNLDRLGVSYHFIKEIEEALANHDCDGDLAGVGSLHAVALRFRLLRQHSYHVPSDVFMRFTNNGVGRGKQQYIDEVAIGDDVKGLLSLYEAAHLRVPGEVLLDEAVVFARARLSSKLRDMEAGGGLIRRLVENGLRTLLLRKMRRLEARHYIPIFEEDDGDNDSHHDILSELAKLDFNRVQSLHKEELCQVTEWWNSLRVVERFGLKIRNRIVECYFWVLVVHFEPGRSRARVMGTKVVALLTLGDDIYDNYGTYEEFLLLTNAVDRWDLEAADELDELMKIFFHTLDKEMKELEAELDADGSSYRVEYLRNQFKRTFKAWLLEGKWRDENHVPSLNEYLSMSYVSTGVAQAFASFIGMGEEVATREVFEWLAADPDLFIPLSMICRIMNDLASSEVEQQRKHVALSVECYMKDHGGPETMAKEEARERLKEMVEQGWLKLNEELLLGDHKFTRGIEGVLLNLARVMQILYEEDIDMFTHSSSLKNYVSLLLVDPIDL